MKLTVFTSTYNRANLLTALYESLKKQTSSDFEWIVIDDGSSDNTPALIRGWKEEGEIDMQILSCVNGGKHKAINRGLDMARGNYFMIIGSDDTLSADAVEKVIREMDALDDERIIGVAFRTMNSDGKTIGSKFPQERLLSNEVDLRQKRRIYGDCCEVFRTDVFRSHYRFPVFGKENFVPEALIWNRMSLKYNLLYIDTPIAVVNYQPNGLSSRIVEIRRNSPLGAMKYYSELAYIPAVPLLMKMKAATNFWRFAEKAPHEVSPVRIIGKKWLWLKPAGIMMRALDRIQGK